MGNGFSFGNIDVKSKKQALKLEVFDNPLLVDESTCEASYNFTPVILTDEIYDEPSLKNIAKFLKSNGLSKFKIISSINCKIQKDEIKTEQKSGVIEFYKLNTSSFYKEIPKNAPIITVGPALYSVLQEDDIYPSHVQQIIFGKPNFWFSEDQKAEHGHYIYPIESFRDIFETKKVSDKSKKPGRDGSYPLKDTGILESPRDSYKTKLAQIQIKSVINTGGRPPVRYPKLIKHFITTKEDFYNVFYLPNKDKHGETLAWDLETSGLNFLRDKIGCITLSFDGVEGYYINWKVMDLECKSQLNEILQNNRQCGANLKFDVRWLWRNGVPAARIDEDVIQLGHTLDETRSNSLKALAFYYSEYGGYERPLDVYKKKLGKGSSIDYINDIPEDILKEYAIMDAIVTWRVWSNMMKHVRQLDKLYPNEFYPENTLERYYYDRNIPTVNLYAGIEYRGCYVDKDRLDKLRGEMKDYLKNIKKELSEKFNVSEDFDWGSGQELGKLLEKKGWEDLGRTVAGTYSTSDFELKRWAKTHPEAKTIRTMRSVSVLLNTFVGDDAAKSNSISSEFLNEDKDERGTKGWSQYLEYHPEDNSWRMHPDYYSMGTDSGRTRCQKPNMQNVPARGLFSHEIKRCLCSPNDNDYYIVTVDYASLQARLGAIDTWAPEDNLCKVLSAPGADLHSATGFHCFSENKEYDVEEITVEQDGVDYHFLGGEEVLVMRDNKKQVVFATDLVETDTLVLE